MNFLPSHNNSGQKLILIPICELHYVIASDVHIPLYRATCVELNASACLYELSSEVKPNAYEGLLK